ncbi:putative tricarboxylic transport membrane protein [Labrenzia sp. EL_208]|uniref:tripartite tricarboxylate transporter permease n=1 Tax=Roseibium album TaxID=311410 RepID=UPI0018C90BE8|nr:tripartite tricarboxylate transporter permease [Roseibium album]MBG6165990.1 putative tricarboxylic transport membrane protein [Labrenzia sp. EL_195]MBG6177963.1 putative tricarboxylic transport membrane protein [Labrenzia sp. EL_132]MBG6204874.1 putative tricarboxylic transport membrane protein [Labrenzia sp. EL_13]MBG6232586.1 putative tricarboxylic transport membrane protein [Labrenzia sp. EL_208]
MIDALLAALQPSLLVMSLCGVCLGIVWGALPGLSTTMAMGLLIGLSAGMSQDVAISFMLGVYTGSVFGGAISAVLINIPGTPDAVPTMIEGHQLAQRGEGGQALGMSIAASFVGGMVGIALLILLIPLILAFALNFKSWEMFWLAIIGIMVAGSMAAGSVPLKGWIAGWIGMLIAFVGLDAIHAVPRFTFGSFALYDGVSYVAVLIGLFGLSEILRTLPAKDMPTIPSEVGRVFPPLGKLAKYIPSALRSGTIGAFVGAIPGAGANVASFLAYDIGRRWAKPEEKAKWGKGSYQAIVCAETANNANIGGSMLPTLALGIPGNAAAAALLAALTLKNVVVGPTIEIDHPGLIYFIYACLIVANLLMYVAAFALIGPCVKLFSLPRGILMPMILPVCVIGAFAVKLTMADVWIMFAAGVFGWLFTIMRFPTAPVVLGVILAPLADENLRRSLLVFEDKSLGFILSQWIGTVLMLAVLFVIIEGVLRALWSLRKGTDDVEPTLPSPQG